VGRGGIDLTGQRFGRLRVVDFAGKSDARCMWLCVCDCGTKTAVSTDNLRSGNTKSCGCLRLRHLEQTRKRRQLRARKLAHNGCRQSVPAWARELKIPKNTIYKRLKLAWPIHLALTRDE
jgi:hypothetical protein